VALAVSGLSGIADMYHRNVLYTSSTGANPQVGGLKSIRAWEPNPNKLHPPDPYAFIWIYFNFYSFFLFLKSFFSFDRFWYGQFKAKNTELDPVTMPMNLSFIMFDAKCDCEASGCCGQIGKQEVPGNYFYRMIGPAYLMKDPLMGSYGYEWRAAPYVCSFYVLRNDFSDI
jgi:hypothetical protein